MQLRTSPLVRLAPLALVVGFTLLGAACTTTIVEDVAAEPTPEPVYDPAVCDVPDVTCPADKPYPGAPCEGALSCTYDAESGVPWNYSCTGGRWNGEPDCSEVVGGCPVAPAAEVCSAPVTGAGAAPIEVGPAALGIDFRPFAAGEEPSIVWGGQGSAMIYYRVRVDADDAPGCVQIRTIITPSGGTPETTTSSVVMRCGETLGMYIIVPYGACGGSEPVPTTLTVEVEGVGSTEATLSVPAEAFCGGFG